MDALLSHNELKATFANAHIIDVLYACLLSFVLGACIAVTYIRTFKGLSYSNAYIQALIFAPILTAVAMQAIGDSVARGLGLMGAFSLLRFRTNIKDTRDMMFIFAALAAGLSCGVYAYAFSLISMMFFCSVAFLLYKVPFSLEADYNAILKFQSLSSHSTDLEVSKILKSYFSRFNLISAREMNQGQSTELTYHVKMKNTPEQHGIVKDLSAVESVSGVHLFMQEGANEV